MGKYILQWLGDPFFYQVDERPTDQYSDIGGLEKPRGGGFCGRHPKINFMGEVDAFRWFIFSQQD